MAGPQKRQGGKSSRRPGPPRVRPPTPEEALATPPEIAEVTDPSSIKAYSYSLPEELIAQTPPPVRGQSRMLRVGKETGSTIDGSVDDLKKLLRAGDVLVLNDTRVVKARLEGVREDTRGRVEILATKFADDEIEAMTKTRGFAEPGTIVVPGDGDDSGWRFELGAKREDGLRAVKTGMKLADLFALLERRGRTPLPPYIKRARLKDAADASDAERYQTVFAAEPGAVAAPTAGLHLTPELLEALQAAGVRIARITLHVGLGTFKTVATDDVREHVMHEEAYSVTPAAAEEINAARRAGGRIVAVGTTAVRTLETVADEAGVVHAGAGMTKIFIHPPYRFRATDALLTNFHVPKSTLLMLVCAFLGRERSLFAYRTAIGLRYRLLSYGDAMFIA